MIVSHPSDIWRDLTGLQVVLVLSRGGPTRGSRPSS